MFARWGRLGYRRRRVLLFRSAVLLGLSIGGIATGGTLAENASFGTQLPAGQANKLIQRELRPNQGSSTGSQMLLLFRSDTLVANDAAFKVALEEALLPLYYDSRVTGIYTPYTVPDPSNLISRDQHMVEVQVTLKDNSPVAARYYKQLLAKADPGPLTMTATGQVPLNDAFNTTLEEDIQRAEIVVFPISLLMLVVIFAAIVAAALPVGVGLLTIPGGLGLSAFPHQLRPPIPAVFGLDARATRRPPPRAVPWPPETRGHRRVALDGAVGDEAPGDRHRPGACGAASRRHAVPPAPARQRRRRPAAAFEPGAAGIRHHHQ